MINHVLKPLLAALPESNRFERIWKLAQVDFRKRYYSNYLGLFWALLNPLFQLAVYYFVFTKLFESKIPYFALYLFIGLLFWMFFAESTKKSINVLITYRYLVENIQCNKIDLFLATTLSVFMGLAFNLVAFCLMAIVMGLPMSVTMLWFPVFVLNICLLSLAVSLLLSTLNIFLKDIHHLWDMVTLLGIWLSPVFYDQEIFLEKIKFMLYLNPFAGILINLHRTVLFGQPPDGFLLLYTLGFSAVVLVVCNYLFQRHSHLAIEKL